MNGSATLRSPQEATALCDFLSGLDYSKPVSVKWGRWRTNAQNRYLWGVVYKTLAEGLSDYYDAHITSQHVHEICKDAFMPRVTVPGVNKDVPMSTTELCRSGERDSFSDYVTQIQEMAARRGIYIPDPDEDVRGMRGGI